MFFFLLKIKKKDDGDWNKHNFTLHELHAFIKYVRHLAMKNHLLSFSFAMDAMDEIFVRVSDSI